MIVKHITLDFVVVLRYIYVDNPGGTLEGGTATLK